MDSASGPPVGHDGPKINGSAAAFYALIIVLSLVIVAVFAAVIYLLLEETTHWRSESRRMDQPVNYESVKDPSYPPNPRWYKSIFGICSSRNKDGKRIICTSRRGQGWIQAGTTDEWESGSAEESKPPKSRALSSLPKEYNPSLTTKRTSAAYSLPRRSFAHSFVSDKSSVFPSDLPTVPYDDANAPSIRHSMYSQLLPRSPSPPLHLANCTISTVSANPVRISVTPRMVSSPVSIEHAYSDSNHGSDASETLIQKPSLRTFEGGTKFIEAL